MGNESGFFKRAKKPKDADVRTEMYSTTEGDRSRDGKNSGEARDCGGLGEGSSMELESGSGERGGLKGRMERLERARRLLDGGAEDSGKG